MKNSLPNLVFLLSLNCVTLAQEVRKDRPTVVLTFDDAVVSHYTHVGPLLKTFGFGATFFVCEFPWKALSDSLEYMTWQQIGELDDMGFEIGNHTRTHKHVNQINREEMHEQLGYIEAQCEAFDIPKPISFAYPAYDTASLALEVLRDRGYRYARIGGSKSYRPSSDNPLLIPSYSTTGEDEQARKRILGILKEARPGEIIVLTVHGVPDTVHPHVNTDPDLFQEYLEYMEANDFNVIAMRDLDDYLP